MVLNTNVLKIRIILEHQKLCTFANRMTMYQQHIDLNEGHERLDLLLDPEGEVRRYVMVHLVL